MRVLLSTYGSRGDVEPMIALGTRLRALGVDVRVCVPPDFAGLLAGVGLELVPVGPPVHPVLHGSTPLAMGMPQHAAELMAAQFDELATAAEDCVALVASGMLHQLGARSVTEHLGIPYVYTAYSPVFLPSWHHPPLPLPGQPFPAEVTENRLLWDLNARSYDALFGADLAVRRAALDLPSVDRVRDHVFTDRPWLATDPTLGPWRDTPGVDVVQTGAWILPDERPLPVKLMQFLDAGPPPIYIGFGSVRAPANIAPVAIGAIRSLGHRVIVGRGWADLALIDDRNDCFLVGEINQQALFPRVAAVVHHGGAGTTTAAARAGVPQVVTPQDGDQPYWASRVAELGIGADHAGPTPTVRSLTDALRAALAPETRTRATAVAGAIRGDGATVAATLLVDALLRPRVSA